MLSILISSNAESDELSAEIWQDNSMIGEVFQSSGKLQLNIYKNTERGVWELDALEFSNLLIKAIREVRSN